MSKVDPFRSVEMADAITVEQKPLYLESCCKCFGVCCADFENHYDILIPDANGVRRLSAKEESGCFGRSVCNPYHSLKLHVRTTEENDEEEVLEISKPYRCCCPALCGPCRKEITVRRKVPTTEVIGYVKEPCFGGLCVPTLDMYREKHGRPLGTIKGPCCCIGGCCKSEFDVVSPEGNPLATIKRGGVSDIGVRRALLSNADKFQIHYTDSTVPVDDKIVMLSSLLFLDYLFFEGETNCIFNCCVCPPQCWCKLCDVYFCGGILPFRVKCCVPSDLDSKK